MVLPSQQIFTALSPESLVEHLAGEPGVVLLRSGFVETDRARYSLVGARPFLTLRAFGSDCEMVSEGSRIVRQENPWHLLESLLSRYEQPHDPRVEFPIGGCFGYWGYDLKNFVEPVLPPPKANELALPDCHLGF